VHSRALSSVEKWLTALKKSVSKKLFWLDEAGDEWQSLAAHHAT
jgi:hypothetical protein